MIRPVGKLVAWLGTACLLYLLMALLAGCTLSDCQRRGVVGWRCTADLFVVEEER